MEKRNNTVTILGIMRHRLHPFVSSKNVPVFAVDSKYCQEYSAAHVTDGAEGEGKEVRRLAGVCAGQRADTGGDGARTGTRHGDECSRRADHSLLHGRGSHSNAGRTAGNGFSLRLLEPVAAPDGEKTSGRAFADS